MTGSPRIAVALAGPTASGKTDLAIELIARYAMQIISVDAAQVYRGMNIGTAKPDVETLRRAPHRLIDIREPSETYSAAEFRRDALAEMEAIHAAGDIPLLAGGTMFYFSVLDHGLPDLPEADAGIRERLSSEADRVGWNVLHERLATIDPVAAARISPGDGQRIQRALEVYEITGQTVTELTRTPKMASTWQIVHLAIAPGDRRVLHERIALRFGAMLEAGFLEEVEQLMASGRITSDAPAARIVGYRQAIAYINGDCSRDRMIADAEAATRQLAKRQLTWLRRRAGTMWCDSLSPALIPGVVHYLGQRLGSSV